MPEFDPDNLGSRTVEELSSDHAQQQIAEEEIEEEGEELLVDAEENLTGEELEQDGLEQEELDRNAALRAQGYDVFETGVAQNTVYDPILNELEGILGYDGDAEAVPMVGELVDGEISSQNVGVDYRITEVLVDTSSDIQVPVSHFADEDTREAVYQRTDVDVDVAETDEGYLISVESQGPESVEEGARAVAIAVAELDQEFRRVYGHEE
ncbi:hypothetical protein [Candidatus Nanohalobium constans]|uniref:Uncharacterized protein n=1 Tax=Candidatus Nanohalobium constans TaxID=2565781 RepID=A0A5Q0UH11_9ARCH|nr:hypothetical protein [Candidatus Nanohalobium constans]QGA80942.1 hypothetical protein LC1Nh_1071 [Candidatus Nanohalobium constans]